MSDRALPVIRTCGLDINHQECLNRFSVFVESLVTSSCHGIKLNNFCQVPNGTAFTLTHCIVTCYTPRHKFSSLFHKYSLPYGLDDRGSRVRFPAWAGNFSLHHRVQNGSGAHPASYPTGTRRSFPGGKAAGA
jgi:hypothetical protein